MNVKLGNRIKSLRLAQPLTQEQMAERLAISRQKYARIESGACSITLELLTQIADILDVTVSDITSVLDEAPAAAYRTSEESTGAEFIIDMIDLFYANKHLYQRISAYADRMEDADE